MYNFIGIMFGGILALIFVRIYILLTNRFVVEPLFLNENSVRFQNSFTSKLLKSSIIASGIIILIVFIASLFNLSFATKIFLLTFMGSSLLSIFFIMLWLHDSKKYLAKLKVKWYHKPFLASCVISLAIVVLFTICTL